MRNTAHKHITRCSTSSIIKKMQILHNDVCHTYQGKKYNQKIPNAGEYVEQWECLCTAGGGENCYSLLENNTARANLKICRPFDPASYLYTLEKFFYTCTRSTLLKNIYSINTGKSPKWKQPNCPPQIKWKTIFWCITNGTLCSHLSGCTSKIWPAKKKGKSENYTVWFHLYQIQNETINIKSRSD